MYLFSRIGHLKKIILKGRGFRCGSDEKMMRMWFGLEIDVVGLPPLPEQWNKEVLKNLQKMVEKNVNYLFLFLTNNNMLRMFIQPFLLAF